VEVALREVVAYCAQIRRARAEDPRLAGEREAVDFEAEVARLHAEAVARAEQRAATAVPDDERPHAVEALDARLAPLEVRGVQHLGVALAAEAMTFRLQLGAQLDVVVDLAVEHELAAAVRGWERLEAGVGEVDDRESKVAEAHTVVGEDAAPVGAAMLDPVEHRVDARPVRRPVEVDDPAEAAHAYAAIAAGDCSAAGVGGAVPSRRS